MFLLTAVLGLSHSFVCVFSYCAIEYFKREQEQVSDPNAQALACTYTHAYTYLHAHTLTTHILDIV